METRNSSGNRIGVAVNVSLGVVLLAAMVFTSLAIAGSWGGRYWVFDSVVGVLLGSVALLRHRNYALTAAAGLAVAMTAVLVSHAGHLPRQPGPAAILALAVLIGAAIRRLPTAGVVSVTAGGLLVVAAVPLTGHTGGSLDIVAVLNALGLTGAVAVGLALRLMDTTRRVTEERVRRDERLGLARELHDVAAHHITGIILQAQAARIVARKRPGELDGSLTGIEGAGTEALNAMRRVVGLLRDTDDSASVQPGPEPLQDLVRRFEEHGPKVRLELPAATWPVEITTTIYRVVQESLTNIARHAPNAATVAVTVAQDRDDIHIEIADDGPPQPPRRPRRTGYGLVGMRERVETLGGSVTAGPRTPAGWSVRATLPAPDPESP